ncbi:hypothetical protein PIB30_070845 [Stylosanthes scabra]|uniref:Uncharacterized protein n=1 Tax=Stylosanthes scabra TaxID=79078 RepID=A0ABU6RNR4_9FABA|nr:hypothetical protein [Stylosanthes scabra]
MGTTVGDTSPILHEENTSPAEETRAGPTPRPGPKAVRSIMTEGTHLTRLEEMTLSNKNEIVTVNKGLVEANERIADTQSQLATIEKLLRDSMKMKSRAEEVITIKDIPIGSARSVNLQAETHRRWKLKVTDLPMCDDDGIEDWVFHVR